MSERKFKVMGVGSPIVDVLVEVSEDFIKSIEGEKGGMLLVEDADLNAILEKIKSKPITSPGGSSGNTAFALARLGMSTSFLGKVGNDEAGLFYQNRFGEFGGSTNHFKTGRVPNAKCLSMITPDGERTMRTCLGAAASLSPDEIHLSDFKEAEHVHIEGYLLFNPNLILKILKLAKEAGCKISLDLASFEVVYASQGILKEIINEYIDFVFANEDEAKAFLGDKPLDVLAKEIAELVSTAVVKAGKDGAYIYSNNQLHKIDALPKIEPIDTTGAGDLWAAGFLYGVYSGKDFKTAGTYGSILGASVIQKIGTEFSEKEWSKILSQLNPE